MKESLNEVIYKYEHGVYDRFKMIDLVNKGVITEKDFKEITRKCYVKDAAPV